MQLAGYQEWIEVFDKDISKIWQSERKELQKTSMLFGALERELQNVRVKIENELGDLKSQLEEKDLLETKLRILSPICEKQNSIHLKNKENHPETNINFAAGHSMAEIESPDLFKNINNIPFRDNRDDSFLTVSDNETFKTDDDVTNIETSPTLNSKYKKNPRRVQKLQEPQSKYKENIAIKNICQKDSEHETSVIDCTPESSRIKTDSSKSKVRLSKRRSKHSKSNTLTQMFSGNLKRKVKPDSNQVNLDNPLVETYYDDNSDDEPMQITDILNYINKNVPMDTEQDEEGELQNQNNTPYKKSKVIQHIEPEPIVRGKARKQMTGFSCEKCAKFYGSMNLSPEELQRKMDECSKHRFSYRQPEDTMPGFWDLSFDPPIK